MTSNSNIRYRRTAECYEQVEQAERGQDERGEWPGVRNMLFRRVGLPWC